MGIETSTLKFLSNDKQNPAVVQIFCRNTNKFFLVSITAKTIFYFKPIHQSSIQARTLLALNASSREKKFRKSGLNAMSHRDLVSCSSATSAQTGVRHVNITIANLSSLCISFTFMTLILVCSEVFVNVVFDILPPLSQR